MDIYGDDLKKCPMCGKEFYKEPFHAYKLRVKNSLNVYCSYHCFREAQKNIEESKK